MDGWIHACMYEHMCMRVLKKVSGPLELELQGIVRHRCPYD